VNRGPGSYCLLEWRRIVGKTTSAYLEQYIKYKMSQILTIANPWVVDGGQLCVAEPPVRGPFAAWLEASAEAHVFDNFQV